ncbi:Uncharacterised protein [Salmonella enterica subsp. enterica serovar Bovismorbificans]|uniref:Uncharacterized protein n=1 Tax=Salmonella enterica subsp. enterica serovar Bovismorbificans TaxID=58097 RepID=A0A655BTE5_SALET|nr:Uncharacterised protein [Salmonella enterica subsp. enterica serovar Bovismorbificans]
MVICGIQLFCLLVFMINDRFEHAIFGKFQHRLQAVDIGGVAGV